MRRIALASALIVAAMISPAAANEIPGTQYSSGFWTGAAYTDTTGAFSDCSVSVGYTNGETLWLGLYTNDTLSVLLSHPDVRFRPGQKFDSWLMLEYGLPARGESEAWDESFAGLTLEGIDATIAFLTQGQYLRLLGIGIDESYDVSGITEALALARDCYARQTDGTALLGSAPPKAPELLPKTGSVGAGGGLGTRPGGALGTPAPKPAP